MKVDLYPTREAWAADRLDPTTIGASEAAAVLGVSPYMTPWAFWEHKVVRSKRDGAAPQLSRGHRWEPAVLAEYEDESGNRVVLPGEKFGNPGHLVTLANELFPWLRESPDAFAIDRAGIEGHLEAKTAMRAHEWSPDHGVIIDGWDDAHATLIPPHVAIQAYVQLAVTGLPWNDVCALVPRQGWLAVRWVRVMADHETQSQLVEALAKWRNDHLVNRMPPDVNGDEACNRYLARRFTRAEERPSRLASAEERERLVRLHSIRAAKDGIEAEIKDITNSIASVAIDGVRLLLGDDPKKSPYAQAEKMPGRGSIDLERLRAEHPDEVAAWDALTAKYTRDGEPTVRVMTYRFPKKAS